MLQVGGLEASRLADPKEEAGGDDRDCQDGQVSWTSDGPCHDGKGLLVQVTSVTWRVKLPRSLGNESRGTKVEVGDELQLRTELDCYQHCAKCRGVVRQAGVPLALYLDRPCIGNGSKGTDILVDGFPRGRCQCRSLSTSSESFFLPLQEFGGTTPPKSCGNGKV